MCDRLNIAYTRIKASPKKCWSEYYLPIAQAMVEGILMVAFYQNINQAMSKGEAGASHFGKGEAFRHIIYE
jgi:hypothetical protein